MDQYQTQLTFTTMKYNFLSFQIKQIIKLRRVWWFAASARTKARFARTKLGSYWLGLSNLLSVGALVAVYGTIFKVESFKEYSIYLALGISLWNSLANAIATAPTLLESQRDLLNNTNIDISYYIMQEWAFNIQSFFQSISIVLAFICILDPSTLINILFSIIPLINFLIFMLWLPTVICILGAKLQDLYQLVPIILQLSFLLTPILYYKKNLGNLQFLSTYNPIYQIISPLRQVLINGEIYFIRDIFVLFFNLFGLLLSFYFLRKNRSKINFLV